MKYGLEALYNPKKIIIIGIGMMNILAREIILPIFDSPNIKSNNALINFS